MLFFQAIGDIACLPILVICFGYGMANMTFVIVYRSSPVVLNTFSACAHPINMQRAP